MTMDSDTIRLITALITLATAVIGIVEKRFQKARTQEQKAKIIVGLCLWAWRLLGLSACVLFFLGYMGFGILVYAIFVGISAMAFVKTKTPASREQILVMIIECTTLGFLFMLWIIQNKR